MEIAEGPVYIIKATPIWLRPDDDAFKICQIVEWSGSLDADNATTILEELVYLAAHLDLAANPIHNDLAGTSLALHFFERRIKPFDPPKGGNGLLVMDLVRRHVHVHGNIVWPRPGLLGALRSLGFEVVKTRGRWRRVAYQNLWQCGKLPGSYPRNPLAKLEQEQEVIEFGWTNPRLCRDVVIPYPVWPPRPATPEMLAMLARWSPEQDTARRYELAMARLSQPSDAYAFGQYLASHDVHQVADWFEAFAPLCYYDEADIKNVLSAVIELESESLDGETLAGALVRLAAKMRRLNYPRPD